MIFHNPVGLKWLAATIFFSLSIHSAHGFFPTTWKENIFDYGGTSHVQQTETAFSTLAASYFPSIAHLTMSMIKARDTIANANAAVDIDALHSARHCDGENLDTAQVLLQTLHQAVVTQLGVGNVSDARNSLGMALHTLQDFYAHSNWIELGNIAPNTVLGRSSTIAYASWEDPTCVDCLPPGTTDCAGICLNCRNNTIGTLLTSGYFPGEDANPTVGIAKCNHGGPSVAGINKDSLACGWSPHFFLHTDAVAMSISATEQYIDDIKLVVTESQIRQLFGVGPTFAFVIDTTGSMGDIISVIQDASIQIVNQRLGTSDEPSTYIMSPFNDPTTGPVTTTSDVGIFQSTLLSLGASGGGDCPELSITGMINAANAMDNESIMFMFTDAAAKDSGRASELIDISVGKGISIFIFKFNSPGCDDGVAGGDSASDAVYGPIALATGGGYHSLPRDAAANVTTLVDALTLSDNNNILKIVDVLLPSGSAAYLVPVDSSVTQITISLRASGGALTIAITDPAGNPLDPTAPGVTIVALGDGSFATIKSPVMGSWRVDLSGSGSFTLDVTGISPLHFSSFVFSSLAGRPGHTGYFPISGCSPYNADIAAIASMDGLWSTAEFSFRLPDGTTLNTLSTVQGTDAVGDPSSSEFFALVRLTPVERYVYVEGKDSAGVFYSRLIPTVISPCLSNDTFSLSNITASSLSSSCPFSSSSSTLSSSVSAARSSAPSTSTASTRSVVAAISSDSSSSSKPASLLARASSSNAASSFIPTPSSFSPAIGSSLPPSSLSLAGSSAPASSSATGAVTLTSFKALFPSSGVVPSGFSASSSQGLFMNSSTSSTASMVTSSSSIRSFDPTVSNSSTTLTGVSTSASIFASSASRTNSSFAASTGFPASTSISSAPFTNSSSALLTNSSAVASSSSGVTTGFPASTSTSSGLFTNSSSAVTSNFAASTGFSASASVISSSLVNIRSAASISGLAARSSTPIVFSGSGGSNPSSASTSGSSTLLIAASPTVPGKSIMPANRSSNGPYSNGTSVTYHSPTLSATFPNSFTPLPSSTYPISGMTVTEVVVTYTTVCSVTLSSTISGSISYFVTQSTSVATVTRTSTIMCEAEKCNIRMYPPANIYGSSSLSEIGLPPVTVTEVVYITTSTCPVTIGTSVSSGSIVYKITPSVITQTLTSIITLPCDKCGPHTITLRMGSVPTNDLSVYIKPTPLVVASPSYITLKVSSVPPAYSTPPAVPSPPECYGDDCGIPAPPVVSVFGSAPSGPAYPSSPGTAPFPSVPECYGPECPDIASLPPGNGLPPAFLTVTPPPCSGPDCSIIRKLPPTSPALGVQPTTPGNTTVGVPSATPSIITFTGGVEKSVKLLDKAIAFALTISGVFGIFML